MTAITKLVVYDSVLFNRTGQVRRWADAVQVRFTANAISEAPLNKRPLKSRSSTLPVGGLKAGISGDVTRIGPRMLQTDISSSAPYSLYVIKGTGPVISPTRKAFMTLPANPGYGGHQRAKTVSGQKPNDFLTRAGAITARRHPSLRGFENQIFRQW
jgi:hypothetical protein